MMVVAVVHESQKMTQIQRKRSCYSQIYYWSTSPSLGESATGRDLSCFMREHHSKWLIRTLYIFSMYQSYARTHTVLLSYRLRLLDAIVTGLMVYTIEDRSPAGVKWTLDLMRHGWLTPDFNLHCTKREPREEMTVSVRNGGEIASHGR